MSLLPRHGVLSSLVFGLLSSHSGGAAESSAAPPRTARITDPRHPARRADADDAAATPARQTHDEWYLPDVKVQLTQTWLFGAGDLSELHVAATPPADAAAPAPVDVSALRAGEFLVDASVGGLHAALLTNEGRVLTAGGSAAGLGRDTRNGTALGFRWAAEGYPLAARDAGALPRIVRVVASRYYTVALDAAGRAWSTGGNAHGQLCLNDTEARDRFHQVQMPDAANPFARETRIVDVALGERHTLLLGEDGRAYGCGWNHYGQLGVGVRGDDALGPVEILVDAPDATNATPSATNGTVGGDAALEREVIVEIAAGRGSSYFLTSSGLVYSMGTNYQGQLCLGHREDRTLPTLLTGVESFLFGGRDFSYHDEGVGVASIAAGKSSLYLRLSNGLLLACGDNTHGQLGLGAAAADTVDVPTAVANVTNVTAVFSGPAASGAHFVSERRIYAVGFDGAGARGNWHAPRPLACADGTAAGEGVRISSGNDNVLYLATAEIAFECQGGPAPTTAPALSAPPTASHGPSGSPAPTYAPSRSGMPSGAPTTAVPTATFSPSSLSSEDGTDFPTLVNFMSPMLTLLPTISDAPSEAGERVSPPGPPRGIIPNTDNGGTGYRCPGFYPLGLILVLLLWL